jgi:type IV secretory pathway TraG/TraD family ATPase VirD4
MVDPLRAIRDEDPFPEAPREWLVANGLGGYASATLWDPALPPPARKTLRTLRAAVAAPEGKLRDILDGIHQNSPSPIARDLAGTVKELEDRTFSGIAATAAAKTDWLSTKAFADLACRAIPSRLWMWSMGKRTFLCACR